MKETKNDWIINKTKNSKERSITLSDIPFIIKNEEKRCIWCGDPLKSKHHASRYCKDLNCPKQTFLWAYPQSFESRFELLKNQDFKCKDCQFNYREHFINRGDVSSFTEIDLSTFYSLRKRIPKKKKPEVDHVIAIVNGGQSLGRNNHQILCKECHKDKTKRDRELSRLS